MIQNPHAEQGTSPPTTKLDAAVAYAARGWAVFPLTVGSKIPFSKTHECGATPHQHGFKDASADTAIITGWWTEHPDANIGLATGKINGITVFDVDMNPLKGKQGAMTLQALVAEHEALPSTLRQQTWIQYLFAYNQKVPSCAKAGGLLDIETRNDGIDPVDLSLNAAGNGRLIFPAEAEDAVVRFNATRDKAALLLGMGACRGRAR